MLRANIEVQLQAFWSIHQRLTGVNGPKSSSMLVDVVCSGFSGPGSLSTNEISQLSMMFHFRTLCIEDCLLPDITKTRYRTILSSKRSSKRKPTRYAHFYRNEIGKFQYHLFLSWYVEAQRASRKVRVTSPYCVTTDQLLHDAKGWKAYLGKQISIYSVLDDRYNRYLLNIGQKAWRLFR